MDVNKFVLLFNLELRIKFFLLNNLLKFSISEKILILKINITEF